MVSKYRLLAIAMKKSTEVFKGQQQAESEIFITAKRHVERPMSSNKAVLTPAVLMLAKQGSVCAAIEWEGWVTCGHNSI